GKSGAAAGDANRGAAGELDAAVRLLELPLIERPERDAVPAQPAHGIGAAVDQQLRQHGIATLLGHPREIAEVLLAAVGAEVDMPTLVCADFAGEGLELVDARIDRAHRADGKAAVAAALLDRRALDHHDRRALLARGQRRRQAGEPGADHQHVGLRHRASSRSRRVGGSPNISRAAPMGTGPDDNHSWFPFVRLRVGFFDGYAAVEFSGVNRMFAGLRVIIVIALMVTTLALAASGAAAADRIRLAVQKTG